MNGYRTLLVRAGMLALVAAVTGGCASVKAPPPAALKDPVPVYLGDFGIHSALLLPTPDGRFVEYVFSDWEYDAKGHDNIATGVVALTGVSGGGAFGRAYHDSLPGVEQPALKRQAKSLKRVWCERLDVYDLIWRLDAKWRELADRQGTPPLISREGVAFVRHPDRYSVANNCNHLTARSLRELGCDVSGVIVWSNFEVVQPAGPAMPALPSISVTPVAGGGLSPRNPPMESARPASGKIAAVE